MFHGILLVAPFLLPRGPGIEDKPSYPDLHCGVPLWKNESQANQTRVASVTMRKWEFQENFRHRTWVWKRICHFFFFSSLLRCIALSLMFLFSFLLMLYIYMILKANHSIRLIMGREAASNSLLQAPHPCANDFKL